MAQVSNAAADETAAAGATATHRDLQRAALRDLVALSSESAASEAQIERTRESALADAEKALRKLDLEIDDRARAFRDSAVEKHRQIVSQVESRFQADSEALGNSAQVARSRLNMDLREIENQVQTQFEQTVWLSESVFEGTARQVRENLKTAKERLDQELALVQRSELDAQQLLLLYGYPSPPPEDPAAPSENTPASFDEAREVVDKRLRTFSQLRAPQDRKSTR